MQALVHSYGEGFIACPYDAGFHWLGVAQINYLMRTIPITGSHVFTIGDDDVFVDGAYEALRPYCAAEPLRPIIYKFLAPNRWILWDQPRMKSCFISGCCIAAPWEFVEPMHLRLETTHDYDWMMAIIEKSGVEPLWLDYVGVIARPDVWGNDVTHRGVWQCRDCARWDYLENLNDHCVCGAVIDTTNQRPRIVAACSKEMESSYV